MSSQSNRCLNKTKCTVITPLYHGKKYIPAIISRLLACACASPEIEIELVLSNDSPEEFLEEHLSSDAVTIKVLNTDKNRGIHGARVRGLLNGTGDYIVFLDQDDRILPEYFNGQLSAMGFADAVVCNALSGGRLKYNADRPLWRAADRESMVNEGNMILSPGQVLLRREAIPDGWVRNVMQNNGADDWLLWLCMHSENRRFVINERVLFSREVHYHNTSFDSRKMAASEEEAVEIIERERLLSEKERKCLRELLPKLKDDRIKENQKWKKMFLIQNDWFRASNAGKSVSEYLKDRNIKKAAVYGYGYLGKTLCENLEKDDVEISCVIDRNAAFLESGHRCCIVDDVQKKADAVIVTVASENRQALTAMLRQRLNAEVLWLEDIVADMAEDMAKETGRNQNARSIGDYSGL